MTSSKQARKFLGRQSTWQIFLERQDLLLCPEKWYKRHYRPTVRHLHGFCGSLTKLCQSYWGLFQIRSGFYTGLVLLCVLDQVHQKWKGSFTSSSDLILFLALGFPYITIFCAMHILTIFLFLSHKLCIRLWWHCKLHIVLWETIICVFAKKIRFKEISRSLSLSFFFSKLKKTVLEQTEEVPDFSSTVETRPIHWHQIRKNAKQSIPTCQQTGTPVKGKTARFSVPPTFPMNSDCILYRLEKEDSSRCWDSNELSFTSN